MMFIFSRNNNNNNNAIGIDKSVMRKDIVIMDYIRNLDKNVNNYSAIYMYINKLQAPNLKIVQKQALNETFDGVIKKDTGEMFMLPNDDILVIFNNNIKEEIQACMIKVHFILHDDPLIKQNFDMEASGFIRRFDLSSDLVEFQGIITKEANKPEALVKDFKKDSEPKKEYSIFSRPSANMSRKELTPAMLGKLQKTLSMADFSSMIRRQAICAVIGKSPPQMLFEEVYVSIVDLRDTLMPDVDMTSNPWLFQYLTETLDKRVLASVSNHDDGSLTNSFSLNLNVSTILSDDFLEFDEDINASMRSTIVLELQLLDIFSDVKAFILAKTFAQSRGYKICIDGISVDRLKYINREQLDADLLKIIWHPSFMDIVSEDKHFTDYMNKAERAKMIICRVDEAQAVEVGNSLGINLYQGRYIQRLLSSRSKKTIFYK